MIVKFNSSFNFVTKLLFVVKLLAIPLADNIIIAILNILTINYERAERSNNKKS